MASQVNPWAQGNLTEDPRLNERFGLAAAAQSTPVIWPVLSAPPPNALGQNGDFALVATGGAGTCIYQRRAGAWVATGA